MNTSEYKLRIDAQIALTDSELGEIRSGKCSAEHFLRLLQSDRCKLGGHVCLIDGRTLGETLLVVLPETSACRFYVDTPDGTMVAYECGDVDYPGIAVDVMDANHSNGNVSLSLTEYIPGGEGLSDYNPSNPEEMLRQKNEVPLCRQGIDEYGHACVTSGFVTRAWPDESANMDDHRRIFHHGYNCNAKSTIQEEK